MNDIEIAQQATMDPITKMRTRLGLPLCRLNSTEITRRS